MGWTLCYRDQNWEIWNGQEVEDVRQLPFLDSRVSIPPFFSTFSDLEAWLKTEEKKRAKNYVVRLLARQNYPSEMLRRKMIEKGFSRFAADEMARWAQEQGYVQDDDYLRLTVQRELARKRSPKAIVWKLRGQGFSEEAIQRQIDQMATPGALHETIRSLFSKLNKGGNFHGRQKAIAALLRRGFDLETIQQSIKIQQIPESEGME
jgi:SOS response regulatory protein OraA/RecX